MKKILSRIIIAILFTCLSVITLSNSNVYAFTLDNVSIEAEIDINGNAHIKEVWNVKVYSGDEMVKYIDNIMPVNIKNFTVTNDLGEEYRNINYWPINHLVTQNRFEEKRYNCTSFANTGRNEDNSNSSLYWGIGEYGKRTYTLNYDLEGVVKEYPEAQVIYFSFIAEKNPSKAKNVEVKIHSDEIYFNEFNTTVELFGCPNGTSKYENGRIVIESNGKIGTLDTLATFIKLEDNVFHIEDTVDCMLEEAHQKILDRDKNMHKVIVANIVKDFFGTVLSYVVLVLSFAFTDVGICLIILFALVLRIRAVGNTFIADHFIMPASHTKLPRDEKIYYNREIPLNGDIDLAYWICNRYPMDVVYKDARIGLISAHFLRLINSKKINVVNEHINEETSKKEFSLDVSNLTYGDNEIENKFIDLILHAAGENKILEPNELTFWCRCNPQELVDFMKSVDVYAVNKLIDKGWIIAKKETHKNFLSGKKEEIVVKRPTKELRLEAIKLKGLKKYLLDFSVISTREVVEVKLWEEYFVFANILGIAKKVDNQLKNVSVSFTGEIQEALSFEQNIAMFSSLMSERMLTHSGINLENVDDRYKYKFTDNDKKDE